MTSTAVVISLILVAVALAQLPLVRIFGRALKKMEPWQDRGAGSQEELPHAAMILCLRGPDPFLAETLRAAAAQEYPHYRLFVIIDHPDDPAWNTVAETLGDPGPEHVTLVALENRRETCSLKCSSLVQVIESLDSSYEIVALLDADTVPHRSWLAELAGPLADPAVGATTGNRWYAPRQPSWGALVRYLWNAAAVVQMYCYGIPWGGTLAVKLRELRQSGLLDRWAHGFCEDTMLFAELKQRGQRIVFVPSLIMLNRESCHVSGFFNWVRRQLLTARLYHPGWPAVVLHGLLTTLVLFAGLLGFAASVFWGTSTETTWLATGLLVYLTVMHGMLVFLERRVHAVFAARSVTTSWITTRTWLWMILAIPLTQFLYAAALLSVLFVRRIHWRGITYQIDGPRDIRMIEYRPFQLKHETLARGTSL